MKRFIQQLGIVYVINIFTVCFMKQAAPLSILKRGLASSDFPGAQLKISLLFGLMGLFTTLVLIFAHYLFVFIATRDAKKTFSSDVVVPAVLFVAILGIGLFSGQLMYALLPIGLYLGYLYGRDIYTASWSSALAAAFTAFALWLPFPIVYMLVAAKAVSFTMRAVMTAKNL